MRKCETLSLPWSRLDEKKEHELKGSVPLRKADKPYREWERDGEIHRKNGGGLIPSQILCLLSVIRPWTISAVKWELHNQMRKKNIILTLIPVARWLNIDLDTERQKLHTSPTSHLSQTCESFYSLASFLLPHL